ncbi:MAG: GAF domain-containing protein [Anaerolineae bacterium]|nr:GAF domain-containing protein [Anaerolineae bacterium]
MAGERILIVDDKIETVTLITDLLEPLGYQLRTVSDGRDGLKMALADPPDLLLLDVSVPGMSGLDVLEALHRQEFAPPVILMAVGGSEEVVVRALRLGVRDYILTPFDINELLVSIDWALAECRLRAERERLVSELQVANDQLTQRMRDLVTLQAVGRSVASVMPRDQVLHRILDAALYLTGADASVIFLVEPAGGELRLEAVRHAQGYTAGIDRDVGDGHAVDVLRSGQPIRLSPAERQSGVTGYLGKQPHSLLYVPVRLGDMPIGVMGVASVREARALPAEAESRLTALADYAAIALSNCRLYEEVEQRARQLAAVNRIARTVVSSLDLDTVITTVVREVRESVRAETASVALLDEEAQDLAFDAVLGDDDQMVRHFHMAVGQGVIGWVVEHGLSARIDDVRQDPRFFSGIDRATGFHTRSLLCVPLILSGRIIGAIEAVNKTDGGAAGEGHAFGFTPEDEALLQGAAAFVALAVENARLHAAARKAVATETLHDAVVTLAHHVNNPLQALMGVAQKLRCEAADWASETPAANTPVAHMADVVEEKVREVSIVLSILQDIVMPQNKSYLGALHMIDIEEELRRRLEDTRQGGQGSDSL